MIGEPGVSVQDIGFYVMKNVRTLSSITRDADKKLCKLYRDDKDSVCMAKYNDGRTFYRNGGEFHTHDFMGFVIMAEHLTGVASSDMDTQDSMAARDILSRFLPLSA